MNNKYFQNFHKHSSYSHRYNKDSPLIPKDYFNYYKELADKGIPTIYSTVEHGWQSAYFRIYDDLEKFNKKNLEKNPDYKPIKFIFGTEAYWVKDRFEKDNSNCHIVLLAKNDNGRKKINRAIYESFNTGYYYKNRMDLDILLSLPKDDVFVTTACIAFWNKYSLEELDEIILKLNEHFTSFYLEVQCHNTPSQKEVNAHILELHYKYGIPIIAGVDSHMIYPDQEDDRNDLLKSNSITYEDEAGWYMDLPTYDELVRRFKEQGVLNEIEILGAIDNTNVILNFEDIVLDRSLKVPVAKKYKDLSQEERNKIFEDIIVDEWYAQYNDINEDKLDEYIKEVKHDIAEIEGCNMADYFIDSYEIMKRGQEEYNGVLTPSGRGSAVSMFLNKLLRLTKVDKVNSPVLMYSERFLTKERVLDSHTPPDIDNNVSEREPFIQAQKDIIGDAGTFDLIAFGTLHYKSAFKMYSRAYELDPQLANEVTKQIEKYELDLKHADEDEKDLIDIFDYVDKEYEPLIIGCQRYMGIIDNLKGHPCATICYGGDVIEDVGVIMVKSESQGEKAKETFVAVIESGTIDSFGYLKQDYLIVDSIGLTYDIYKEANIEPLSVNELLSKIEKDKATWDIYANGHTMCINQCEQKKSTEKVMRFSPKNIAELTQFVAGIRPSFQSMYSIFEKREHFDYGIKAFDDLIQDQYCSSSFILYQEHLMKVLGFAGFPMSETYTIIKAISKKKEYIIKGAKEKFIPNFAQAIINTKETDDINKATEMAEKVWKVVEDSAAYGFNSAHAYCMAIDSVTLAWLKAHYPLEFYKVALQRYTKKGDKDKVTALKSEMLEMGYKLKPIKFGDDNRDFVIDRENNCISQTMSSIKNMQKIAPDILYNIGLHKDELQNLFFIFNELGKTKLNKKSIDILIKLNYFSDYGDINYVLYQLDVYRATKEIIDKFKECKQLKKLDCEKYGINIEIIREFAGKETEKLFKEIDSNKLYNYILDNYQNIIDLVSKQYIYKPTEKIEEIAYEIGLSGYTNEIDESLADNLYIVSNIETNKYGTNFVTIYQVNSGKTFNYKINRKVFQERPCSSGDILKCVIRNQFKRIKDENDEWIESQEEETILKDYVIIKRLEDKLNEETNEF